MNLEEAAKTATGEEHKAIMLQIANLNRQRTGLMGVQLPEYKEAIDKSIKMTNVGLQMQAGRKPGTLAEGVWQKKQKQKAFKGASAGFTFPYTPTKKKEIKAQPTPTELRARGTKEAFDIGVKLGYWTE
jgi:hypothetical protein